ncbi:MAG: hypothetical protein EOO01_03100 [Chitinophagaceae bacterium]|nr:MAG: hypothetical protein EOO01_03100 [Chitinophagaceae bacterium]
MKISSISDLDKAILELEKRKVIQESLLRAQFEATKESLKPLNLVKSSFSKLTHTPEVRDGVAKTVVGVGLGLLTKNLFLGKTYPVVRSLINNAVERSVNKGVNTGTETLKAYGKAIYNNLFKKNKTNGQQRPA